MQSLINIIDLMFFFVIKTYKLICINFNKHKRLKMKEKKPNHPFFSVQSFIFLTLSLAFFIYLALKLPLIMELELSYYPTAGPLFLI